MTFSPTAHAIAAVSLSLCCAGCMSTVELAEQGRYDEACTFSRLDERHLVREVIRKKLDPRIQVQVATPKELEELLPVVPKLLRNGRYRLVTLNTSTVEPFPGAEMRIDFRVPGVGGPYTCCDEKQWERLNARKPSSWFDVITKPLELVFETYATAAGVWSDAYWVLTAGDIDVDLGKYSLRGRFRQLKKLIEEHADATPEQHDEKMLAAQREAQSLATLRALAQSSTAANISSHWIRCDLEASNQCTAWFLLTTQQVQAGEIRIDFKTEPPGCNRSWQGWTLDVDSEPEPFTALNQMFERGPISTSDPRFKPE